MSLEAPASAAPGHMRELLGVLRRMDDGGGIIIDPWERFFSAQAAAVLVLSPGGDPARALNSAWLANRWDDPNRALVCAKHLIACGAGRPAVDLYLAALPSSRPEHVAAGEDAGEIFMEIARDEPRRAYELAVQCLLAAHVGVALRLARSDRLSDDQRRILDALHALLLGRAETALDGARSVADADEVAQAIRVAAEVQLRPTIAGVSELEVLCTRVTTPQLEPMLRRLAVEARMRLGGDSESSHGGQSAPGHPCLALLERLSSERVWRRTPTRWEYVGLGAALVLDGRRAEAEQVWDEGLRKWRQYPSEATFCYRGELRLAAGEIDEALTDLEVAIGHRPRRLRAALLLGQALERAGRSECALCHIGAAVRWALPLAIRAAVECGVDDEPLVALATGHGVSSWEPVGPLVATMLAQMRGNASSRIYTSLSQDVPVATRPCDALSIASDLPNLAVQSMGES